MLWVQLVTLLAVLQFLIFGFLVGKARQTYNVPAPATSGAPIFERYFRVQMNTLETLVVMLPSLWIAASYWRADYMAILGAIYLVGRQLYLRGYVADPKQRSAGYGLSFVPTAALLVAALVGVVKSMLHG
jgi:glutathione S-transferase